MSEDLFRLTLKKSRFLNVGVYCTAQTLGFYTQKLMVGPQLLIKVWFWE